MHRSLRPIVVLVLVSASLAFAAFSGVRAASGLLSDIPLLSASFVPSVVAGPAPESMPALQPAAPAGPVHSVPARLSGNVKAQSISHLDTYRDAKRRFVQHSLRG